MQHSKIKIIKDTKSGLVLKKHRLAKSLAPTGIFLILQINRIPAGLRHILIYEILSIVLMQRGELKADFENGCVSALASKST